MQICIWIDCDDVLSETMNEIIKRSPLVEKWIKLHDITSYSLFEVKKIWVNFEEAVKIFYSFFESEEYHLTQSVSGAYEKLYQRKEQWHKLFVVTGRPEPYEEITMGRKTFPMNFFRFFVYESIYSKWNSQIDIM